MKFTFHKEIYTNKFKRHIDLLKEFIKIDRNAFLIMCIVEISFVSTNFFNILILNRLFINLSLLRLNGNFDIIIKNIVIYAFIRMVIEIKNKLFNGYYMQFVLLPRFELKCKVNLQDISKNIKPIDFEDNKVYHGIYKSSVAATNIFRIVELYINKASLILNLILISIFFIRMNWIYIIFLLLIFFISSMKNISLDKVMVHYANYLNKFNIKKEELTNILINKNYAKDNEIYNVYPLIKKKISNLYKKFNVNLKKILNKNIKYDIIINFFTLILTIGIYLFLSLMLESNKDFASFAISFFVIKIIDSINKEYQELSNYQSLFLGLTDEYFDFYKSYSKSMDNKSNNEFDRSILLEKINFKYPNSKELVLKDLSLKIDRGKTYAIIGPNGSGKSSLANILLSLYDFDSGYIYVDGKKYSSNEVFSCFNKSAVFQDYAKYSLSMIDNIYLSEINKNKKIDQIISLLNDFDLNNYRKGIAGIDFDLSKGQWQQIAIIKCLYRNRDFVVFDEPTNDIDPMREKKIFDFLKNYKNNRTIIIISHKLISVKLADEIIVMDGGEIIQKGKFNELLKEDGLFRDIWRAKSKSFI